MSAWERIKEHKILQWGLGYLGAALALGHGADLLGHAFHWPEITQRLILGLLIVGLPLVLTLAWYHGHKGLKTVSHGEMMIASILVVIGAGLLIVLVREPRESEPNHAVQSAAEPVSNSVVAPAAAPSGVTLAVLPFADMSAAHDQEYFSDGLTEEILNQLAQIKSLRVTGRTSSFSFKGKNEDLRVIGQKLGVGNLLEGSVRKDGKQLRITVQLIGTQDGAHLWSRSYDRELSGVFALQEDVAKDVARALSIKLDVGDMSRVHGGTTSVEAYDKYLRAQDAKQRGGVTGLSQAVQFYRDAVALDPNFALAWYNLLTMLPPLAVYTPQNAPALMQEMAAVQVRLETMPLNDALAVRLRAGQSWGRRQWAQALTEAQTALQMSSGARIDETVFLSIVLQSVGRFEDSLPVLRHLVEVDPLAYNASEQLSAALFTSGRVAEARAEFKRGSALDGAADTKAADELALFWFWLGKADGTPMTTARVRSVLQKDGSNLIQLFPHLADKLDDPTAARELLHQAFDRPNAQDWRILLRIAQFADHFGDRDLALAALRRSYIDLKGDFAPGIWSRMFSDLRTDPRFKAILREMGLADYFRASGNWGDFCKPLGAEDFECH